MRRLLVRVRMGVIAVVSLVVVGLLVLTVVSPRRLVLTASASPVEHDVQLPRGRILLHGSIVGLDGRRVRGEVLVFRSVRGHQQLIYRGGTHTAANIYRLELSDRYPLVVELAVIRGAFGGDAQLIRSNRIEVSGSTAVDVSAWERSVDDFFVIPVGFY